MTILFALIIFLLMVPGVSAKEIKPLHQLPEKSVTSSSTGLNDVFLVGSDTGLYRISKTNNPVPLWTESRVDQIQEINYVDETGKEVNGWMLRTKKGLFYTEDFQNFKEKDNGLAFLTIKKYDGEKTSFEKQIQSLKDFAVNPSNNLQMVTATKDAVYYSEDGGENWKSLGLPTVTTGMKAVAIATYNEETVVFTAHPITGFYYKKLSGGSWVAVKGFDLMPTLKDVDEIADILPVVVKNEDGSETVDIYVSQTYLPRLYKYNWDTKTVKKIYTGSDPINVIDGLTVVDNVLMYTTLEGYGGLKLDTYENAGVPSKADDWEKVFSSVPGMINTAFIPKSQSGFSTGVTLNELWLLYPGSINTKYAEPALDKKCIYASAYQCRNQEGINKYVNLCKSRNMNGIVIDMKDDSGFLRYKTNDPLLLEVNNKLKASLGYGSVSSYAIDLDHFVEEFKKNDIYLVARIVAFKDKCLSKYDGGKYAVWNSATGKAWQGVKGDGTMYDEFWCDPYCEKLWEYDVQVAKELVARGFDEVQFDYIRFPTDGINLGSTKYRWKSEGMDKESALISFLSYARENIDAPISIDIYGANGWYRSGARTGQDSEMLSEYVDVIGPMFYPSHFEQSFLNCEPFGDRTYRIYYYGTFRNTILTRNRAIIRPWVQSFYLGVSYDYKWYDVYDNKGRNSYVTKQLFGVRDSVNRGYMCWNNSGNYGTTPKDVTNDEPFTGSCFESQFRGRVPAIGNAKRNESQKAKNVASLDKTDNGTVKSEPKYMQKSFTPFLTLTGLR